MQAVAVHKIKIRQDMVLGFLARNQLVASSRRPPMHVKVRKPCKSLPTAMVGTRSRGSRRRLSDNDIRCSASERRWFPARPAQHVHRRRNNGKGQIQSAFASAHGRNGERRGETCNACNAGRARAYRPSEALHSKRSSDVLPRIARERVPTLPTLRKRVEMCHAGSRGAGPYHWDRPYTYVDAHGRPPDVIFAG